MPAKTDYLSIHLFSILRGIPPSDVSKASVSGGFKDVPPFSKQPRTTPKS